MYISKSNLYKEAINKICVSNERMECFSGKKLLVTGATGMIGSCIVDTVMQWNEKQKFPCHIYVMNRSTERAKKRFDSFSQSEFITFVEGNVYETIPEFADSIDYVIHTASNADPVKMTVSPVDTLLANVEGTNNLIKYGIKHGMNRFLYLSSGEMYGQPNDKYDDFVENYCGEIDHSSPRACYPAGKRAAEVLCQSYISQYGVDAVIVRPCHIFGATMTDNDSRAVSQFFRNAVNGQNIVLKSAGTVERSHCNVVDAVNAIFYVMFSGKCGEAYNIADKNYQMTIRAFAEMVAKVSETRVVFDNPDDIEVKGYSRVVRSVLSAEKLERLGWYSLHNTENAIEETYYILKQCSAK